MARRTLFAAACAALFFCGAAAFAQSSADFYAGKTVKIVFGTSVGGEYGLYAQLLAQHIGKHVPGAPTVIAQSMPGGGGMTALNYVAKVAAQDGTVLSLPHVSIAQDGLLNPNARFHPGEFRWIGRVAASVLVGIVSSKVNVGSIADARTKELIAGGAGANNQTSLTPRILNALAGTKFKVVTGYKGAGEVMTAWERGEVDVVTANWDLLLARFGQQVRARDIIPLYVHATTRPQALSGIPTVTEFGRTDAENAFLRVYGIASEIGRSLAAPPGVPKARLDLWRTAFAKMLADPEFKAAVSKGNIRLNPLDGETLAAKVARAIDLSSDELVEARKFYAALLAGEAGR